MGNISYSLINFLLPDELIDTSTHVLMSTDCLMLWCRCLGAQQRRKPPPPAPSTLVQSEPALSVDSISETTSSFVLSPFSVSLMSLHSNISMICNISFSREQVYASPRITCNLEDLQFSCEWINGLGCESWVPRLPLKPSSKFPDIINILPSSYKFLGLIPSWLALQDRPLQMHWSWNPTTSFISFLL